MSAAWSGIAAAAAATTTAADTWNGMVQWNTGIEWKDMDETGISLDPNRASVIPPVAVESIGMFLVCKVVIKQA